MIQDAEIPRNLAALFRDPQKVRDAFVLLRQVANLKVITDDRPITTPKVFPNARDMTLDLRSGTPTGAIIPPAGGPFIPYANNAFIVCQTTNSATGNAALLNQAYVAAKALLPNGVARSASNRAAVIVMPGVYDFGTSEFTLDAPYVDLIGLSASRKDQTITSTLNATNLGTIHKSVDDVVVANLTVTANTTAGNSAAWYPDAAYPAERIINCEFDEVTPLFNGLHSMRYDQGYSGYYEDCRAGAYGWGQGSNFAGTAVNCVCTGEGGFGSNANCSGTLVNCECQTRYGFGGQGGTFSGKAFNCRAVENAFAGDDGSGHGVFSGFAFDCYVSGTNCFGNLGAISATARIMGCVYRAGTFVTPAAGAFIVGSIDATGIVNFPAIPGFLNPMTTSGDTIYGGAAGVATRLPIGAAGALNFISAGIPAWLAPTVAGAILYLNGSLVPTWLAPGLNGATLQIVAGIPTWVGGTPPADTGTDYIAGQVFNTLDRQAFNISTYNG